MTENDLLNNLREDKTGAFRQLVEKYKVKVINTCYRFVADKEDAEDIAQDTFIEIYRSISSFREESELSTWIYRIAVSKSLDFVRKKNRKKRKGIWGHILRLDNGPHEIPAPSSTNPDIELEQKERRAVLQQALDSLPKNQSVAFVLSKYDGLSYKEIADILKTSVPSVESLIHRAKTNLKKKLYKYYKSHL